MSLVASMMEVATEKQALRFVSTPPDVCLIPAPPPPTGPQGIPTPFPIMTSSGNLVKSPAAKVRHKGGKVMNTSSVADGIKGNNAGVGQLPPGTPKKDILTMVNTSKAQAVVGCPNVKSGGKPVVVTGCPGVGNIR